MNLGCWLREGNLRTVARKSSIGGFYVCAGGLYVCAGGHDIKIWKKFHWFIVFQILIWGDWSFVWEAKLTKIPVATGLGYLKVHAAKMGFLCSCNAQLWNLLCPKSRATTSPNREILATSLVRSWVQNVQWQVSEANPCGGLEMAPHAEPSPESRQ